VISDDALNRLKSHEFPGNVRELKNLLQNIFYTNRVGIITAKDVASRLSDQHPMRGQSPGGRLNRILDHLVSGPKDFWQLVRDPFLNRDLSRREVRWIVAAGLEACNGSYRKLVEYFGMNPRDYKRFLAFLSNHECKVDFRLYRRRYGPLKKKNKHKTTYRNAV
jgi:two-component system nitrogen regulation response regulator GlnG